MKATNNFVFIHRLFKGKNYFSNSEVYMNSVHLREIWICLILYVYMDLSKKILCGCQRYTYVNGPISSTSGTPVTYGGQMLQKNYNLCEFVYVFFAYVNNTSNQKYHK